MRSLLGSERRFVPSCLPREGVVVVLSGCYFEDSCSAGSRHRDEESAHRRGLSLYTSEDIES